MVVSNLAYDGSIKIDTKIDTSGFKGGIDKIKSIAQAGVSAVTATLAGITATLGAGATAAATVGSSFEAAMSKVSAISGATGDSLQSLTDKAKEMGAKQSSLHPSRHLLYNIWLWQAGTQSQCSTVLTVL